MKLKLIVFTFFFIFMFSCSHKTIDTTKEKQVKQLDSLFKYSFKNDLFNGAVLVTKNNAIVYKKSFGYKNKQTKQNIDENSVFYLASISKQFTAMAILLLKEKGKLSFNSKVEDFFPEYPERLKQITIKQLLNHTSGILDNEYYKLINPSNDDVLKVLLQNTNTKVDANQFFRYSNSGYVLLATIIEKVAQKNIADFFKDEIFTPLQMNNTTAIKDEVNNLTNMAIGYSLTGEKSSYKSSVIGPGGIYSTLNDLYKWNLALNQNTLVTKETLNLAFTNGNLNNGKISLKILGQEFGYGFGWVTQYKNGKKYVNHDGSVDGFRTLIKKNLSDGYDYILLTNHGSKLPMTEIINSIDGILEKTNYQQPKTPVINQILAKVETKDFTGIYTQIYDSTQENKLVYNQRSLNSLGYRYLKQHKLNAAIAVFKLNTKLFPKSANAFDSLAEGYYNNKQYELSKINYLKSLELNPANENAKLMIEKINQL